MDKRIELTEKQQELVKRLSDTFEEMKKEDLGVMLCDVGDHYSMAFVNKSDVLDFEKGQLYDYGEEEGEWYISEDKVILSPNPEQVPVLEVPCDMFLTVYTDDPEEHDEFFSVVLNPATPEELEEVKCEREREKTSLPKEIESIKKNIEEVKDAIEKEVQTGLNKQCLSYWEKKLKEKKERLALLESIS